MAVDDDGHGGEARVVPLGVSPPQPPPARRPSRLHSFATSVMALFALFGVVLLFALFSVNWGDARRVVLALIGLALVGFLAAASAAVFAAAGESYRDERERRTEAK